MSVETIHQELLKQIDNKFDKSDGSWTYDVTKATAIEFNKQELKTDEVLSKLDVENLSDEELTLFVRQRTGVERRQATYSNGFVIITTTGSTTISVGDLVAADDVFYGATNNYTFNATGEHLIHVRCQSSGSVGNVPVGAIKDFPVTLTNVSTVTNAVPFTNGYEAESDESLREQYYNKLRNPGKSGNPAHYREWASEVPGVGKIRVYPRFDGPLNVRVAILDVDGSLAPQQLLDDTFNHIETKRPFGANVSIVTGVKKSINITATFYLREGYTWQYVEPLLETQLNNYFKSIAFEDSVDYVSYAQVGREILFVEGIDDYRDLLINSVNTNIQLNDLEVCEVGTVTNV